MKIKVLAAAIAASACATQALALSWDGSPDVVLTFSGATAVEKQFEAYITDTCTTGTQDNFFNAAGDAQSHYCEVADSITGAGDLKVLFQKENGGSSTGVVPISYGTTSTAGLVKVLDMTSCADDDGAGPGVVWTCSDTTIDAQSEIGISDVEPELFSLPLNIKPGATGPVAADLTVQPVNVQTFGIVVSPGLRDALQAAQGLIVGSDEISQMPSLSSVVIANIFAGAVDSWDKLMNSAGVGIATAAGIASDSVNVCVRRPGSGTQAQFNAFYMGYGCDYRGGSDLSYGGLFTSQDPDADETNGYAVPTESVPFPPFELPGPPPYFYWAAGSSDMGRCLTQVSLGDGGFEDGSTNTLVANADTTDDRWAIGIQSLEKVDEGRVERNHFKYVAIDGIAPTLENVAAGLYRNVASASIQWNNDVVTTGSADATLAQRFVDLAQDITAVADFNAGLQDDEDDTQNTNDNRPAGGFRVPEILVSGVPANVGSMAFGGTNGLEPGSLTAGFDAANPVSPFNKGLVGPTSCNVGKVYVGGKVDVSKTGH